MQEIRCLTLDVDGVLTDGRLWYGPAPEPLRAFHIHDGLALRWFQRLGGTVIILTGKRSEAVARRAAELQIANVIQGSEDKLADLEQALDRLGMTMSSVAAVGDDLPDLPVLRACALPIAVANAVDEVKAASSYVTRRAGGQGAVREVVERLLEPGGRWSEVLEAFGEDPRAARAGGIDTRRR